MQPRRADDDACRACPDDAFLAPDGSQQADLLDRRRLDFPRSADAPRDHAGQCDERAECHRHPVDTVRDRSGQGVGESNAQGLRNDLGNQEHGKREHDGEDPQRLLAEHIDVTRAGHGRADRVRDRVDDEDGRDRHVDPLLEAFQDATGTAPLAGQEFDLCRPYR